MNRELDERIRERAYAIWEEEGQPEGQDFAHWLRAVEDVQAEEAGAGILSETSSVLSDPDRPNAPRAAKAGKKTSNRVQPAGALHATALPGASAAPVAQGVTIASPATGSA